MNSDIEKLKKLVRSVLMSSKEGVPEHRFMVDYKSLTSCQLKPEKYGFKGVRDLLGSMPDVARILYSYGQTTYHAVQNKETAHIQSLVSKQKSKKKRKSKKTTYKCCMPYHRSTIGRFTNPLMMSKPSKHQPVRRRSKLSDTSVVERALSNVKHAITGTPSRPVPKSVTKTRVVAARQPGDSRLVSPVIVNRIKSILGTNPNGLRFPTLQKVYKHQHGVDMPHTVLNALQSRSIKGLARVEEYQSGKEKSYIMYPLHKENEPCSPCGNLAPSKKENTLSINTDTCEVSISDVVKSRLKTLLLANKNGFTFWELKSQYKCRYGDISDSILHGLECGQIKGVTRVERRCIGNREYVTFFPIGSSPSNIKSPESGISPDLPKKEVEKDQGTVLHGFRQIIDKNDHIVVSGPHGIQSERKEKCLEIETKNMIETGHPERSHQSDCQSRRMKSSNSEDNNTVKFPKYPAVPLKVSRLDTPSNPLHLCMEPNSLHYGTITHASGGTHFYVKIAVDDKLLKRMENIREAPEHFARPIKAGSYVLANGQRGEVLSVIGQKADIYHLDFGHIRRMDISELDDMPSHLLEVPRLAVLCKFSGVHSEDDEVQAVSYELLQKYMNCQVIVDVISTKSENIHEKLLCVHNVQCYVRSESKNLNLEVIETIKESMKMVNHTDKNFIIANSSSVTSSISPVVPDGPCIGYSAESLNCSQLEEGEPKAIDGTKVYPDLDFQQRKTTPQSCHDDQQQTAANDGREMCPDLNSPKQETSLKLCDTGQNDDMWVGEENIQRDDVMITLPTFPCYQGKLGKMMIVKVTRVITPNQFYMVPVERLPHLQCITTIMTEHFLKDTAYLPPCKPTPGDKRIYAAVCRTSVPLWRRVEVTHIAKNYACVYLVDLGQVDCVPVSSLRCLPREIALLPKLAIVGKLGGVVIKSSQQSAALNRFRDYATGRQFIAHVMDCCLVKDSLVFDVSLLCTDDKNGRRCINDVMVEEWKVSEYISL